MVHFAEVQMENQKTDALIYTNDNCVGCNKCISVCPVLTANHAVEENGENRIVGESPQGAACAVAAGHALTPVHIVPEASMTTRNVFFTIWREVRRFLFC